MDEIIANATLGLLMILFQGIDPIFTVLVLRFAICDLRGRTGRAWLAWRKGCEGVARSIEIGGCDDLFEVDFVLCA